MAADKGYLGSVTKDANKIAQINAYDIQFEAGEEEDTEFGDEAVSRAYTIKDVSGTFSGLGDKSDTTGQNILIDMFLSGGTLALVWLYLYVSGAKGYYGQAVVTPGKGATPNDLQTFTCSFRGSGLWYQNVA